VTKASKPSKLHPPFLLPLFELSFEPKRLLNKLETCSCIANITNPAPKRDRKAVEKPSNLEIKCLFIFLFFPSHSFSGWFKNFKSFYFFSRKHELECDYAPMSCPNSLDCPPLLRLQLKEHLKQCPNTPCDHSKHGLITFLPWLNYFFWVFLLFT